MVASLADSFVLLLKQDGYPLPKLCPPKIPATIDIQWILTLILDDDGDC